MPTAVFPVRPLSWKTGGSFACVVGIRTEDESGAVLLFESDDGFRWHYVTVLDRSYNEFGKMWECQDFFSLEGEQVLLLSPTGRIPPLSASVVYIPDSTGTLCMSGAALP